MLEFWQHIPSHLDPTLIQLGPLPIRWYGLMYLVALIITYLLANYRITTESQFRFDKTFLADLVSHAFIGILIGGRLGYVLFYNFGYFYHHPEQIILPFTWDHGIRFTGISGMSFHGGLAGALSASYMLCRKRKVDFLEVADLICPIFPIGYTFGRLGNFINGELFGRTTSSPIGMFFPLSPTPGLRYPSQLFEAVFEGFFLFLIFWNLRKVHFPKGFFLAAYLIGYGSVRFFIEFYRQPDEQLGFVYQSLSMGQVLCMAMISIGILLLFYLYSLPRRETL